MPLLATLLSCLYLFLGLCICAKATGGSDIVMADSVLSQEERIAVDAMDVPIEGAVVKSDASHHEAVRSRKGNKDCSCIVGDEAATTILKKQVGAQGTLLPVPDNSLPNGVDISAGAPARLHSIYTCTATIKYIRASLVCDRFGVIALNSGSIVLRADSRTIVKAGQYLIWLQTGTIALLKSDNAVITVEDLYDRCADSIQVYAEKSYVRASAGQEIIIGLRGGAALATLKGDRVLRRSINYAELGSLEVFRSQVLPTNIARTNDVMKLIVKSKDKDDIAIVRQLVLMARMIIVTTSKHSGFAPIVHAQ
jgi:hypothetical protein